MSRPLAGHPFEHPATEARRLWSLWDMLTKFARQFIQLGEEIAHAQMVLYMADSNPPGDPERELRPDEKSQLAGCIQKIVDLCPDLDLPVTTEVFSDAINKLPSNYREFEILTNTLRAEIKNKLFVYVPTHRTKFMQPRHFMSEATKEAFPVARKEMAEAGRCHAVGMYTAAVFHCVRAVEIGLRAMATDLKVELPIPLDLAEQETLIAGIESKVRALKEKPKSEQKDADQNFYSQAAMQFRYFKDGWRIRVAHTRATYDEPAAQSVIEHAATFIDILAARLKEPVTLESLIG
jgi:HEPN domain-containing protein